MGADEEGTLARLKACRKALVDPKIAEYRGRIVKTTGDGMLVEFGSAVDAVRCAVEVQRGMALSNVDIPESKRVEFRIGIHVGDIIIDDNDIFGDGVNIAAALKASPTLAAFAFLTTPIARSGARPRSSTTIWVTNR
jgi:adenylate cyclase